jgi:signal transduction histidine kinase
LGWIMEGGEAAFWEIADEAIANGLPPIVPGGSFAALPLRSPSRMMGLICLASRERKHLGGDAKGVLRTMADEVGIALENALLYIELQDHVAELEKVNRELRGLDEMKSNFISAISHELKQPLALVSGFAQTIYDYSGELTREEEMQCLRVIIERAQFLADLVEDLLDISMLETGRVRLNLAEVDIPALAVKVAEEFMAQDGDLEIETEFPPSFPLVMADALRIEQVFYNLVSNAVKFSPGKGKIRLSGRVKGDMVQVRVEDEGVGIDPGQLEKIFDLFHQADASTRRPYAGVGLGLSICRQLIEEHGGKIWAENRPERGSVIVLEIPVSPDNGR